MTERSASSPSAKAGQKSEVRRRDGAGHLDPAYAARLREQSGKSEDSDRAFVDASSSEDDLSEQLGQEFIANATSGEDQTNERFQARLVEEDGGPFVETDGATEFADDVDASNPVDATREPIPKA